MVAASSSDISDKDSPCDRAPIKTWPGRTGSSRITIPSSFLNTRFSKLTLQKMHGVDIEYSSIDNGCVWMWVLLQGYVKHVLSQSGPCVAAVVGAG